MPLPNLDRPSATDLMGFDPDNPSEPYVEGDTVIDQLGDRDEWLDANKSDAGHTHAYDPAGTAAAGDAAHVAATDPHGDRAWASGQFIPLTQRDAANGVAVLDAGQKIALARIPQGANGVLILDGTGLVPTSALPPLAINETFVVASQAAMLALSAQRGDMAIRTDTGLTFVLATDSPGTLADWKEVLAAGQVTSVAGKTGVVTLAIADVAGLTAALAGKVDTSDARLSDARTPTGAAGGDLTGTYPNPSMGARAVGWSKVVAMTTARILGRKTAGSGDVEELTGTDVAAILPTFGASQRGLVPAAAASPSSSKYLSEDGTFTTPAGASSAGVVLKGSSAPGAGLGSDGDWYRRSDQFGNTYRKVAGAWVLIGAQSNWLDYQGGTLPAGWAFAGGGGRSIEPAAATQAQFFNQRNTGLSGFSMSNNDVTITTTAGDGFGGFYGTLGAGSVVSVLTMPGAGQTLRFAATIDVGSATLAIPSVVVNNAGAAQVDNYTAANVFSFTNTVAVNHSFAFVVMTGGIFITHLNASNAILQSVFIPTRFATPEVLSTQAVGFLVAGHGQIKFALPFIKTEAT